MISSAIIVITVKFSAFKAVNKNYSDYYIVATGCHQKIDMPI